jgi:hypothetical protein
MELVSKEMIDEVMALFADRYDHPRFPFKLNRGETITVPIEQLPLIQHHQILMLNKPKGVATITGTFRYWIRGRSGFQSVYNYSSPKHRAAMREARYESLGQDDEWSVRDGFAQGVTADEMLYGEREP